MLDTNHHVSLIEVNNNPCLEESNTFLKSLLERMVHDMFALTVDKVFPSSSSCATFPFGQYPDS